MDLLLQPFAPPGSVLVRPAAAADIDQIEAIERLCFADPFWDAAALSKYECLVASDGEAIAGFLIARQLIAPSEMEGEREILNFAVHPAWRRRGIAKMLLTEELRHGGTFFLEVRESNFAARKLYENMGFTIIGRRPAYYSHPPDSGLVMRRK